MDMFSPQQAVELFHLLFLNQMGRKIPKDHYVLKGGCNLRFFLKSIRYSQDMDLDIDTIKKDTLNNAVNRILESTPFTLILRSKQIEIAQVSQPKQTETTQRWKIQLKIPPMTLSIPTKIEFSRRGSKGNVLFELVDSVLIHQYQITPLYASHYSMESAFEQKIWALILRTQTQARDIFDLSHLLNSGVKIHETSQKMQSQLPQAIENALSIEYETYKSQVIAYLPRDYQQQYSDPALWETMVLRVVDYFQAILGD